MINRVLQFVDFISPEGKLTSGLVPIHGTVTEELSIAEQVAVNNAKSFEHIDFIFFRRFTDGRSSQIAAYIVDNSKQKNNEKELSELHREVWLQGAAPLLYIAWPSRIDILTCARGPDFWIDGECKYKAEQKFDLDFLNTAREITSELRKFSAFRLADGTFWEEPSVSKLADHTAAAHHLLIQAIVETDNELEGEKNPTLRRLLLLMVLIKYLEDRKVFPSGGWFGQFHKGARNFFEVLQGGDPEKVYRLLSNLERKFNGDIFVLPDDGQQRLTKAVLGRFAELVESKTIQKQRFLWGQFSFEHLPVEIISHLYQRFVQHGHGAVYTPPFLASLLLDFAMPYDKLTGKERILDAACGSGVFLVGAYRRLVNIWRSQNAWKRPDVNTLKEILRRSIYGVEIDQSAISLTVFSLYLAICDALQPDVIWKELKFEPLSNVNLFEKDFFDILLDYKKDKPTFLKNRFDIIVGNPPFESKLSSFGAEINETAQQQDSRRGSLPDKQSAYLFLEQAFTILHSGGHVCLIQPSVLLYNLNAQVFRSNLFQKYRIEAILDFTSVRNLYDGADPKTIAILAYNSKPSDGNWIDHKTFRRTVSVYERICFELDHYDCHRVSQKQAITNSYVWRTNLLGGGRLNDISHRLQDVRTLKEYIKQKRWDYGEGYIAGNGKKLAPFLTRKKFLPTEALTSSGIQKDKISTVTETHFESPRCEERFTPPLILIRELDKLPIAFWDQGFIAYRHQIVGIHAPESDIAELRELYNNIILNHNIYRLSCALNSKRFLISMATSILKLDIDSLPYPEDINNVLSFSFWEKALCDDVLKYLTEYVRLGQNSELLKKKATIENVREYSDMFLRLLGSVYDELQAAEPVFLGGLICQPFYFGKKPNLSWSQEQSEGELEKIIYDDKKHVYLRTIRVLRFYSDNFLLIVKPDRLRYWIRSTAIRDADETLIDLRKQGY